MLSIFSSACWLFVYVLWESFFKFLPTFLFLFFNFSKDFIFRQRGRKEAREGEKHQCVVASHAPPTGGPAGNPDTCPIDWESNL